MGGLRFILAFGVVFHHLPNGISLMNGGVAVELFFVVSGFYMALVLNEKYDKKPLLFYSNRLLRLAPVYYIVLFLQIIAILFQGRSLSAGAEQFNSGLLSNLNLLLSVLWVNIFVIGQELFSFLTISTAGEINWDPGQIIGGVEGWKFLLIPQAWSISLELMFYLLAPFLIKRKKLVIALCVVSWMLHKFVLFSELPYNSWGRRAFPLVLHFFLMGIIAFQVGEKYKINFQKIGSVKAVCLIVPLLIGLLFSRVPNEISRLYVYPLLTLYTALLLPLLFYSIQNRFDRELGELSYPIYITHVLCIGIWVNFGFQMSRLATMFFVGLMTLLLSLLIYKLVEKPVNYLRQRRVVGC